MLLVHAVCEEGPTSSSATTARSRFSLDWQVSHAPLGAPVAQLARFHAKWHRDAFLPERDDRKPDWTLLTTQGRGRYVGTHLHGWNPEGSWWGEGDDKFFVDGEKFPSTLGTGSEDYFGYAWSSEKLFSRPYHNQILNDDNSGHFDDNRWHIADSVPFTTSFEADIEKYLSQRDGHVLRRGGLLVPRRHGQGSVHRRARRRARRILADAGRLEWDS